MATRYLCKLSGRWSTASTCRSPWPSATGRATRGSHETDRFCRLGAEGERLLRETGERFHWSALAYYRVLKVACTITDLAGDAQPDAAQIGRGDPLWRAIVPL